MNKDFLPHVALVEDDLNLIFFMQKFLHNSDFYVTTFKSAETLMNKLNKHSFDLFLLDIGLPNINGLSVLKQIRKFNEKVPVIIITNKGNRDNEIEGFSIGANLFHKKPINFDLLLIQMKNLIKAYAKDQIIELGDLYIDTRRRVIKKDSKFIKLTYSEFNLLILFVKDQCKIFTREDILTKILADKTTDSGAVDTLISRLRKKLGTYKGDSVIETIYKSGFRLSLNYFKRED